MSDDRFAPPGTEVLMPEATQEVSEAILKKIQIGWLASVMAAAVKLIFVLIAVGRTGLVGKSAYQFLDVGLILGLAFGIYKKSRICAVLFLAYFVWPGIVLIRLGHADLVDLLTVAALFYFGLQGVIGTFAYHRHLKQKVA